MWVMGWRTSFFPLHQELILDPQYISCFNLAFSNQAICEVQLLRGGNMPVICASRKCCSVLNLVFFQCCEIAQQHRYTRYGLWLGFCSCLLILQKKPPRENGHKPISSSSTGCLPSPNAPVQSPKHEWKIIASEKTSSKCIILTVSKM